MIHDNKGVILFNIEEENPVQYFLYYCKQASCGSRISFMSSLVLGDDVGRKAVLWVTTLVLCNICLQLASLMTRNHREADICHFLYFISVVGI